MLIALWILLVIVVLLSIIDICIPDCIGTPSLCQCDNCRTLDELFSAINQPKVIGHEFSCHCNSCRYRSEFNWKAEP